MYTNYFLKRPFPLYYLGSEEPRDVRDTVPEMCVDLSKAMCVDMCPLPSLISKHR